MKNLARFVILLIVCLSSPGFSAQSISNAASNQVDTLCIKAIPDTAARDTCCNSIRFCPDSVLRLRMPYNQNALKFRYDAFKMQMKHPWIADALREILSR